MQGEHSSPCKCLWLAAEAMGMKTCAISSPLFVLLVATILPIIAGACTVAYPTVNVGPSFIVKVSDRGRPVQGLRLNLVRYDSRAPETLGTIEVITDDRGQARFNGVLPGSFSLSADHDGGIADGVNIEVARDGPSDVIVPLRWPSQNPVRVRTVSGELRDPLKPLRLSLSLLEGLSARVIQTTDTDSSGHFSLSNVVPGIYFLRLNPFGVPIQSTQQAGDLIAIDVSNEAEEEKLDLELGWSSCGLSYTDRTKCSHAELNVGNLCGTVVDAVGAVISGAEVLLLDASSNPNVLGRTRTDAAGRFALQDAKNGTYHLVVSSPGFYPLQEIVRIQSSRASERCSQPVSVRLGLFGSCSSAELIQQFVPEQRLGK